MWNKFEYFSIKDVLNFIKIKSKINLNEYDFYIGEKKLYYEEENSQLVNFIVGIELEDYIRYKIIEELMIVNNPNVNTYFMNYWYFNISEYDILWIGERKITKLIKKDLKRNLFKYIISFDTN